MPRTTKKTARKQARRASRKTATPRKQARRARRKTATARKSGRSTGSKGPQSARRWSAEVTKHSNALDLEQNVFTWKDPKRIARSLKRSAEHSQRRKASPYSSAMSMLTFYINRAGKGLPVSQRRVLERAKQELRKEFGRD